jgi:hypothetical protein
MEPLTTFARHVFDVFQDKGAVISTLMIAIGAAFSAQHMLKELWDSLRHLRQIPVTAQGPGGPELQEVSYSGTSSRSPSQVARERAAERIAEAKLAMTSNRSSERFAHISSVLLTVGQYIIGGVLASSFVQESLSPKSVGFLGVLVLIASLVKQQFHPELNAENARRNVSQLRALIRTSEDQLTILDAKIASGQDHTDAMIDLMTKITQRLNEIENLYTIEPSATSG